jgi:hypothetical protein
MPKRWFCKQYSRHKFVLAVGLFRAEKITLTIVSFPIVGVYWRQQISWSLPLTGRAPDHHDCDPSLTTLLTKPCFFNGAYPYQQNTKAQNEPEPAPCAWPGMACCARAYHCCAGDDCAGKCIVLCFPLSFKIAG